jgi:hypothetical protein
MADDTIHNELYLGVLPLMRMFDSPQPIEEFLTLYPDKNFATNFFPDEVTRTTDLLRKRLLNLTGGHVIGYDLEEEQTEDGRFIIKVIQHVH